MRKYEKLLLLNGLKSVCLLGHIDPDTDAFASMLIFKDFLKKCFGVKRVDIFAEYNELGVKDLEMLGKEKINPKQCKYEACVSMDTANIERHGIYADLFKKAKIKVVIDHHDTNTREGQINIVEICSSTCEIVSSVCKAFGYNLNESQKAKIYAGIITDTNNFQVGAIKSRTFKVASECCDQIDTNALYRFYFENNSIKNMQMLSIALQNMTTFEGGKILITQITKEEAKKYKTKNEDFSGIANRLNTITGVKMLCFIEPKDDFYYVSMRSKPGYNVAVIAQKNGGGGHVGASAFNSTESIEKIEQMVLLEFMDQMKANQEKKEKIF